MPIEDVKEAAGHAHIGTTLDCDRRRKKRNRAAFRVVSGLVAEDHTEQDDDPLNPIATRLAAVDAEQIPGQTAVSMPGYGTCDSPLSDTELTG